MADYINLYRDYKCKEPIKQVFCGLAGFSGSYADLENGGKWSYSAGPTSAKCYTALINGEEAEGTGGVKNAVFSGGVEIFNVAFTSSQIYDDHALLTDQTTQEGGTITNAFFISSDSDNLESWCLRIAARIGYFGDAVVDVMTYRYNQTPYDGERRYWEYNRYAGNQWTIETPETTQFGGIYLYSVTIGNIDYYLLLVGAGAGGTLHPTKSSYMLLIPTIYFIDQIPKPYVGPVSKESAESAYITGSRPKNNVEPRTLTNKNLYGFNSDGVFLTKISGTQYRQISSEIYNGLSGNALNALGQVVSTVVGGNSRRPAEEIKTIIDGVFCCHAVPNANRFPTTGTVQLSTICGYDMFSRDFPLQTIDRWEQWEIASGIIPRPSGSFLDFSPYTTVTLSIPILGNIDIDPSALLGNALSLWFTLDAFTGSLSCDISIVENGAKWIYSTLQGNCAVELPMIGAGQNANPLLKIAGGVSSIFTGGAQNIPNAIISVYDGIQQAAYTRPISRVQSSNILPIVAPTDIYLTITTPNNVNAGDYWTLAGIPSHMSGNVGDFRGFTVFEHVDLSGVSGATESELSEIEATLKGGVWL